MQGTPTSLAQAHEDLECMDLHGTKPLKAMRYALKPGMGYPATPSKPHFRFRVPNQRLHCMIV